MEVPGPKSKRGEKGAPPLLTLEHRRERTSHNGVLNGISLMGVIKTYWRFSQGLKIKSSEKLRRKVGEETGDEGGRKILHFSPMYFSRYPMSQGLGEVDYQVMNILRAQGDDSVVCTQTHVLARAPPGPGVRTAAPRGRTQSLGPLCSPSFKVCQLHNKGIHSLRWSAKN